MDKKSVVKLSTCLGCAITATLLFVLCFAAVIKAFSLPVAIIRPVNVCFKIVCVFLCVLLGVRGEKRLLKGIVFAIAYFLITNVLFCLISRSAFFSLSLLSDGLLCLFVGVVSGVCSSVLNRA